tara:strand:+ start:307 stop:894 length:588 start_codon:yes stop_codon:yes gene_type:complete
MSMIRAKRFTKLRKELEYWNSELKYIQEVLKEWHHEFERFQRKYCEDNNIDLNRLNQENSEKVNEIMSKAVTSKKVKVDFKKKNYNKQIKKIYKELAKILHPDVGGNESEFKKVTSAMSSNNLQQILDICDEHNIQIEIDDELFNFLKSEISEVKKQIEKEKSTYSWKLYNCDENDKCKNNLMKQFLKHFFNYRR